MTEQGIAELRETMPEMDALIVNKTELSVKAKEILGKLDKKDSETLMRYYELAEEIADIQIKKLYLQGAVDCVQLLKRIGIIQ